MARDTIKRVCLHCHGSYSGGGSCPRCNDAGTTDVYFVDHGDNVFHSYIILEELDATEHAALTDAQKDGILHLLTCGFVDLNTGKAGRVRLWNWFGAESTTVANLTALLT